MSVSTTSAKWEQIGEGQWGKKGDMCITFNKRLF